MEVCYIGVDVGTGSARAALVTKNGKVLKSSVQKIQTWNSQPDHYEQSSEDIWNSCVSVIKNVIQGYSPQYIKGIGFDATCSLVAISNDLSPQSISLSGDSNRNIILWMDHRAKDETDTINNTKHDVLKFVGGKVSLEMQMPKLLWIKNNLPETWKNTKYFFDLPDYLTWKATGSDSRSLCSLVCKWNYVVSSDKRGFDDSFLKQIGLEDLTLNSYEKIGKRVCFPGDACGNGLDVSISKEIGLLPFTSVGTSLIDAHSGGLGMIGCDVDGISQKFESRLGLICGTSTCHMAVSKLPIFVSGVWGPYYSAMIPEYWLSEAGQSASGALIDHIINNHPAVNKIKESCPENMLIPIYLNQLITTLSEEKGLKNYSYLTESFHLWPDYHGNRSPVADSSLLGMISGLNLQNNEENLCISYLATIQALAYGTRHIIDSLIDAGHTEFSSILICGGLSKNSMFVQIHADVLGLPIICPNEPESVLVGAAILGARAANPDQNIDTFIKKMGGSGEVVLPCTYMKNYHDKKYKVFLKMLEHQILYRNIMAEN